MTKERRKLLNMKTVQTLFDFVDHEEERRLRAEFDKAVALAREKRAVEQKAGIEAEKQRLKAEKQRLKAEREYRLKQWIRDEERKLLSNIQVGVNSSPIGTYMYLTGDDKSRLVEVIKLEIASGNFRWFYRYTKCDDDKYPVYFSAGHEFVFGKANKITIVSRKDQIETLVQVIEKKGVDETMSCRDIPWSGPFSCEGCDTRLPSEKFYRRGVRGKAH